MWCDDFNIHGSINELIRSIRTLHGPVNVHASNYNSCVTIKSCNNTIFILYCIDWAHSACVLFTLTSKYVDQCNKAS